jgi:hypothetical protein
MNQVNNKKDQENLGSSPLKRQKLKRVSMCKYHRLCFLILGLFFSMTAVSNAQKSQHYDLIQLYQSNNLDTAAAQVVKVLPDSTRAAISLSGLVWLKNVNFAEGTIEVELRGKEVFQQSFLGIAFYGVDTSSYDVVYFRPFNFRSTDSVRRKHAVQYMSAPDFTWEKLRKEHPLVYENSVNPAPMAEDWFTATIVVKGDMITVYVNHSIRASLMVKKLNSRSSGKLGLWSSALPGDFANLTIF